MEECVSIWATVNLYLYVHMYVYVSMCVLCIQVCTRVCLGGQTEVQLLVVVGDWGEPASTSLHSPSTPWGAVWNNGSPVGCVWQFPLKI